KPQRTGSPARAGDDDGGLGDSARVTLRDVSSSSLGIAPPAAAWPVTKSPSNGNGCARVTGKGLKTIAFVYCKNDICISVKNLYLKLQIFECCNQARRRC